MFEIDTVRTERSALERRNSIRSLPAMSDLMSKLYIKRRVEIPRGR
jgi:hypothetical protein